MTVFQKCKTMDLGQVCTIKYDRNPKGKEITIIKAAQRLGRYFDIHQDVDNKSFILRRIK